MAAHSKNEALYRGKRHYDEGGKPLGGIKVMVDDSYMVEVEGGEYKICAEAYNSKEVLNFKGKTNKEILDHIHNNFACKFEQNKANSGDFILCRLVVNDKKPKDYSGNVRQILDMMQAEQSCRVSFGSNTMKKGGIVNDSEVAERWEKKKEHIDKIANSIRSLRYNITKDLKEGSDKERLTALVIAVMDKTAERIGNNDSASDGHFGVTGFKKRHIKVIGDKVVLNYVGKSGVRHEKEFTDSVVAQNLKRAINESNCEFVFCTEDGFRIKADRVNRYLSEYGISAKDIRGYSANRWIIDRLNNIDEKDIPETEQKRARKFNKILKSVAAKVGHGSASLKKHYLLPELESEFVEKGKIIDLSDFYKKGGKANLSKTPAPKSERIYGSKVNKPESAASESSAKEIKLSNAVIEVIERKIKEHNESNPDKKISLSVAKAVVRRGMGAYSVTHRPTISGGKPNSRVAWGLARLNAFLYKAEKGKSKSGNYIQDDDLLDELEIKHKKYAKGGNVKRQVVGCIVYTPEQGFLLLQRGDSCEKNANKWHILSGGVDSSETLDEAALREISEEICWDGEVELDKLCTIDFGEYDFTYYFACINDKVICELNYENKDYEWVKSIDEMLTFDLIPELKEYMVEFNKGFKGSFAKGGSVLLAPNGKPSNLTPEQYKLVRTPEFKAWFGDWEKAYESGNYDDVSKVIDEETKEPLVVYHGTTKEFNVFNLKYAKSQTKVHWGELGFFFTPSKELALDFTKYNWASAKSKFRKGSRAIGCFISIKKPKKLLARQFVMSSKSGKEYRDESLKNYDGWIIEKFDDDDKGSWERIFGVGSVKEFLYNQYVTFYPTQIKLADGTNTTFDSSNPDIRFAGGGVIGKSRSMIPNVRGGWTKDKILRYLKEYDSDTISTYTLTKFISELNNWQELKSLLYYHGTANYIERGLKPSIVFSERVAERIGGGGYGQRYWGISLTKRKRMAEAFSGMSKGVTIYPVFLKKDAVVIERTDLSDSSEVEDIIVELYEKGIDAVWIGGGEEELVVVNPRSIMIYKKGSDYYNAYGGFKSKNLTDEEIENIYEDCKSKWYEYYKKYTESDKDNRELFIKSLEPIKFIDGGSVLLAPNGKPSNLTAVQYFLVRTPEFKAWFGDWEKLERVKRDDPAVDEVTISNLSKDVSKIVDENGEPLVVYKGGHNDIYRFHTRRIGRDGKEIYGSYFSSSKVVAESYLENTIYKGEGVIYEVFLSLKNPLIVNAENRLWNVAQKNEIITKNYKGDIIDREFEYKSTDSISRQAKENNNDGIIVLNVVDSGSQKVFELGVVSNTYAAFEPNQIKLADGTNTTFDSGNPDIRFEEGGEIVYHGSPYDFKEFTTNAIGTGEGASGWGYGLYFTEDKDEANDYACKLEKEKKEGRVYTAEIPDSEKYLDFHDGFKKQSAYVKRALTSMPKKYKIKLSEGEYEKQLNYINDNIDEYDFKLGDDEYWELVNYVLEPDMLFKQNYIYDWMKEILFDGYEYETSEFLYKLGIKGVKHNAFGFKNYIVFNEEDIKVLNKDIANCNYRCGGRIEKISKYFIDGGSVLLAPNGKPSKLTPEQWHLVRTPEFKAWFGDWENYPANASKVVDENGEPLVVYHGTNAQINIFDTEKIHASGESVFKFTTNYEMAIGYGKNVYAVFLSVKNNEIGHWSNPQKGLSKFYANTTFDKARLDLIYESKKANESQGGVIYGLISNDLKNKGDVYFVHYSNQIKLADGTNTTFDSSNPDIRYAGGGSVLLAPNDKPSNLTPEQYKLVRTPEFKAWFGDWENDPENASKVVDSNGEPLVVFHGTNAQFWKFDKSKGKGNIKQKSINFSSDKKVAENYGTRIIPCFLNLRKPLIKDYKGENYHTINFNARFESRIDDIPDYIVNNAQSEKNYDGVIFLNIQDSKSAYDKFSVPIANNFYAFNNKQIKLADGTNTTFDSSNPDIRFAVGGSVLLAPNGKPSNLNPEQYKLVRTPEFKAWFGDWEKDPANASKVVDENGEPLVVYHGTSAIFNTFKEEEKGSRGALKEFYWSFTTNFQQAIIYALDNRRFGGFGEPRIIKAFLSIKKMPIYDNDGKFYRELEVWAGYKYIDVFQLQDFHSRGFNMGVEFEEVDGFCVKNTIEMENYKFDNKENLIGDTYYVKNSNQIKLADGTNTTFDSSNPDIRYADGGSVLLAPNGKPSKLTPEQWHLVRTPEFKAWFGDWENYPANASKVVDENGEPLPLYHGSRSEFNVFDIGKSGASNTTAKVGFWFTPIKSFAENFASTIWYGKSENVFVYSVFLSIKKPKIYETEIVSEEKKQELRLQIKELQNESLSIQKKWVEGNWEYKDRMALDYSIRGKINNENYNYYSKLTNKSIDAIADGKLIAEINKKIDKIKSELDELTYSDSYQKYRTDIYKWEGKSADEANTGGLGMALSDPSGTINKYIQSLTENGYDGIIISKTRFDKREAGGLNDQYVALFPEQIKLADGTNTTFDIHSPDIRYEGGGKLDKAKNHVYQKWKKLVNMTASELEKFYESDEGKEAGLSPKKAKELGIHYGRESARWIIKMKNTPVSEWTETMWEWAARQNNFISRMLGNSGSLYDGKGNKTRKHTSLLIWGHNPVKGKR